MHNFYSDVKQENMAQTGGYREELEHESKQTDPNSHAFRLIAQEIERLNKGEDEIPPAKKSGSAPLHDLHHDRPQKISVKVRLPSQEYPRYNFVGKLLGPKGQTLKALQEQTGCKMAIMGRGSMRDKDKEEELRKEGGKYSHLEEDLHVLVECYAEPIDAHHRLAEAQRELKKFVIPQMEDMYEGNDGGMNMGAPGGRGGRGGFRGGPPGERGGRGGGFRGGRGAGPPPPPARGGRGGGPPPARGAPRGRGGPPPSRGGGRGAAPNNSSYDGYGSQSYGSGGGYESSYDNYGAGQGGYSGGGDAQYYDYGGSNQNSGYDSYSGYEGYGDSWNSSSGKAAAPSGRGSSRGQGRSHPYPRSSGGSY